MIYIGFTDIYSRIIPTLFSRNIEYHERGVGLLDAVILHDLLIGRSIVCDLQGIYTFLQKIYPRFTY